MAEYIKRWDVSSACYDIFEEVEREHKAMTADEVKQTMLRFEKAILLTPIADVVEVRHGYWIDKPTGAYNRMQSWCSACGKHSGIGGIESNRHKPYCPNCGAKMDGGKAE
jgi:PHP family Zn ribbon phosphoesterase